MFVALPLAFSIGPWGRIDAIQGQFVEALCKGNIRGLMDEVSLFGVADNELAGPAVGPGLVG